MISLNIETATDICSLSLAKDKEILFSDCSSEGNHARTLPLFIQKAVQIAQSKGLKIGAVAVSAGPGSYTGLRIATATAKGLCYASNIPLIFIPTLSILCQALIDGQKQLLTEDTILCPMIDARRMEVYTALYDNQLHPLTPTEAKIIDSDSFTQPLENHHILFFGNGAVKCQTTIKHPNAIFINDIPLLADYMAPLSYEAYLAKQFQDIAYAEPNYLKQYNAIKSTNRVLNNI